MILMLLIRQISKTLTQTMVRVKQENCRMADQLQHDQEALTDARHLKLEIQMEGE